MPSGGITVTVRGAEQISARVKMLITRADASIHGRRALVEQAIRISAREVLGSGSPPSPPGSPPAPRTGNLRDNWSIQGSSGFLSFNVNGSPNAHYAGFLEGGTMHMDARPFASKIMALVRSRTIAIAQPPYMS